MTFSGVLSALGRRWYIVLIGLLLSAGIGWGVTQVSPPEFTARGLVLLLPPVSPPEEGEVGGSNPLLSLGGLDLPARVVVASFSSNAAQAKIAEQAPDAVVEVAIEESTRGPIISVDVTDSTAQGALDTLAFVADEVAANLQAIQVEVSVPEEAIVRSIPLTMDTEAEADYSTLIRLGILGVGVGLALTVVVVYLLDGVLARTVRRDRRGHPGDEGNPQDEDEDNSEDEDEDNSEDEHHSNHEDDDLDGAEAPVISRRAFPADPLPAAQAHRATRR